MSVSIVSHAHGQLVVDLLDDLDRQSVLGVEAIVTLNVPEQLNVDPNNYRFPVTIISNSAPRGFGSNHNAAFMQASGRYFCVANPDVRLKADPFPALMNVLADRAIGVVGPSVQSPDGAEEDSARRFPTVSTLVAKAWRRLVLRRSPEIEYSNETERAKPDWIGGMFMLFRSEVYHSIGGFDEAYYLYYEDVDLCWRLRRAGYTVALAPSATVVHAARRASWGSWRFARWHLASMLRFLLRQARA